jgi:hypothetical protein
MLVALYFIFSLLAWCDVLAISFLPSPIFHCFHCLVRCFSHFISAQPYISLLAWCDISAISLLAWCDAWPYISLPFHFFHFCLALYFIACLVRYFSHFIACLLWCLSHFISTQLYISLLA